MQGTVVSFSVQEGAAVHPGEEIMVMEAMKMQHSIAAEVAGIVIHSVVILELCRRREVFLRICKAYGVGKRLYTLCLPD